MQTAGALAVPMPLSLHRNVSCRDASSKAWQSEAHKATGNALSFFLLCSQLRTSALQLLAVIVVMSHAMLMCEHRIIQGAAIYSSSFYLLHHNRHI